MLYLISSNENFYRKNLNENFSFEKNLFLDHFYCNHLYSAMHVHFQKNTVIYRICVFSFSTSLLFHLLCIFRHQNNIALAFCFSSLLVHKNIYIYSIKWRNVWLCIKYYCTIVSSSIDAKRNSGDKINDFFFFSELRI